jgi:hypothetical protein
MVLGLIVHALPAKQGASSVWILRYLFLILKGESDDSILRLAKADGIVSK